MEEDYDLVRIMFETINDFAKSHGCDCLLTAKEVDVDTLNEDQIQWLRDILNKWDETHK